MKRIKKNYQKWMDVKSDINNNGKIRKINEGDVVWVAIGENVGVEIDGKSEKYSRPMIVFKKHSALCFTGIPLTSKKHIGSWYCQFKFQNKIQTATLIQAKLIDTSRVYSRMGELSKNDFKKVRMDYAKYFFGKNMP